MISMDVSAGSHISDACEKAVALVTEKKESVEFIFNDTPVAAHVGESAGEIQTRWSRDSETRRKAYLNSKEYKDRMKKERLETKKRKTAHLIESAQTEVAMREAKDPQPHTEKQLTEYIESLVKRQHDYGTCVYAMSLAAVAAFNYVASELGVTGFQASCADLDILRRTRNIEGAFIILKLEDALYPQHNLREKLEKFLTSTDSRKWLQEHAKENLKDTEHAHPDVLKHWQKLAGTSA